MNIFNSKKANVGAIGGILLFIFFLINWFIWLGKWVGDVGKYMVVTNQLVGVEAFFFYNLNFVIFICMILGVMGMMYFGSAQQ